jgi:hypothetical protein
VEEATKNKEEKKNLQKHKRWLMFPEIDKVIYCFR